MRKEPPKYSAMKENMFDFDPTCGFTEEELLKIKLPDTEPFDFAAFWQNTHDEAMGIPYNIKKRKIWSPVGNIEVSEVYFDSWEKSRIGAWMLRPLVSKGGIVVGHDYSGCSWFDLRYAMEGFTVIFPCIRGFNLSADEMIPWRYQDHVLHKIDSRDDYVLRGAVVDIWRAAGVLMSLYPDVANNLNYAGSSFGGGLGALALPWDRYFRAAYLDVPTFGHHPLRLSYKSVGSGEEIRKYYKDHPEIIDVLYYYDAATASQYIDKETICTIALCDPVVIPPGQFAIANALGNCARNFILPVGHCRPEKKDRLRKMIQDAVIDLFSGDKKTAIEVSGQDE